MKITINNETKSAIEWCRDPRAAPNLHPTLLISRYHEGLRGERLITKPAPFDPMVPIYAGLYLYGYPTKEIPRKYWSKISTYQGEVIIPSDPGRYTYFLSQDQKVNVHARGGRFYVGNATTNKRLGPMSYGEATELAEGR